MPLLLEEAVVVVVVGADVDVLITCLYFSKSWATFSLIAPKKIKFSRRNIKIAEMKNDLVALELEHPLHAFYAPFCHLAWWVSL